MLSQLTWIRTYPDDGAARAAQRLLDTNGIHSIIADEVAGANPALQYVGGIRLGVREGDARAALLVLDDGGGT